MMKENYAGFWIRAGATIIDTILLLLVMLPAIYFMYGGEILTSENPQIGGLGAVLNYIFPAAAIILFWIWKSATPGKLLTNTRIVDASSGGKPTTAQLIGRYFAYFLSSLPLGLGFFWVIWDKRKQGWHDKLAGTLVVKG